MGLAEQFLSLGLLTPPDCLPGLSELVRDCCQLCPLAGLRFGGSFDPGGLCFRLGFLFGSLGVGFRLQPGELRLGLAEFDLAPLADFLVLDCRDRRGSIGKKSGGSGKIAARERGVHAGQRFG
ncbi:MAG: hypothetical protein FJ399_22075 [Verrucomicrobia bacterium]|nr:hypothetical protein [Verrucomicrobiota bacterium]